MAKRRTFDVKIRDSQTFASLTYRQRDLWQGLIVAVDDQGRMPADPRFIRSRVWPFDEVAADEVEADLQVLVELKNIIIYQVENSKYLQIINWHYYQRDAEWLGISEYPSPKGWTDHARYHGKGNKILTLNWDTRNNKPTLFQGSALPSNDVNDDVNDDVNGDGDDEGAKKPSASASGDYIMRVISKVTGLTSIPDDTEKVIPAIEGLYYQHNRDEPALIEYLKPFYQEWITRKGKDGRKYQRTNFAWLYQWAVAGEIPEPSKNGSNTRLSKTQQIDQNNRDVLQRALEKGANNGNP